MKAKMGILWIVLGIAFFSFLIWWMVENSKSRDLDKGGTMVKQIPLAKELMM